MAPFVGFFHALPACKGGQQAGEGHCCRVPPSPIERFKGFVGEIQDMAHVQVAVVCRSSKQHIRNGDRWMPGADRRGQTAFGAFAITHLDKLTQPALEGWQIGRHAG